MAKSARMRRAAVIAAVGAVVAAGLALAAFRPGRYAGTTARGGGVSFVASRTAVSGFTASVVLRCSNGARASTTTRIGRMAVRGGRFSSTGSGMVRGRLAGRTASGTLAVTIPRLPDGHHCRSGALAWRATRAGAARRGGLTCAPAGAFDGSGLRVEMRCAGADFDAFTVELPRPATRADTSTAHLSCLPGRRSGPDFDGPVVTCSADGGAELRSGRVVIRFSHPATCADAARTKVTAMGDGDAEYGPFPLRTDAC